MPTDGAPAGAVMGAIPSLNGRPAGVAIHASAVAIAGAALLILGPSRSGKSRLAFALMNASTKASAVRLVGDDRILLNERETGLVARPHPRIAGFIELRGFGILACRFVMEAPVRGCLALGPTSILPATVQNFPCLRHVTEETIEAAAVLRWWRGACTTPRVKASVSERGRNEDWNW